MDGRFSQHLCGKTLVNAVIGGVGMLLGPHALKSLNSTQVPNPILF